MRSLRREVSRAIQEQRDEKDCGLEGLERVMMMGREYKEEDRINLGVLIEGMKSIARRAEGLKLED